MTHVKIKIEHAVAEVELTGVLTRGMVGVPVRFEFGPVRHKDPMQGRRSVPQLQLARMYLQLRPFSQKFTKGQTHRHSCWREPRVLEIYKNSLH